MPREVIPEQPERKGPPEVYVTLRDLIGLQHQTHGFSFLPRHSIQSLLSGRHRSKLRGRGLDFDEVRQYVSGDDIRNIDWKVTARVGTTHTKVFTEERERPVLMVVDQSASMFFGSSRFMKSVVAAHLAALGSWRTLEVGDRIGGIVFGKSDLDYVAPKRDRRNVQRLLSLVAERNQALGPNNQVTSEDLLDQSLGHAEQVVTHDFLIVVISDFRTFQPDTLKKIIRINRHNDLILAQVSDPMEFTFPEVDFVLGNGTYQTSLDRGDKTRTAFFRAQSDRQNFLRGQLKRYGIPLLQFSTREAPYLQLRNSIGGSARIKNNS